MIRRLITLSAGVLMLASCGAAEETQPVPQSAPDAATQLDAPAPATDDGVAREVAPEPEIVDPAEVEAPAPVVELDAEQIVTATVLIASGGDLEAAIEAGIIGEAEAEAALSALESGSIDDLLD